MRLLVLSMLLVIANAANAGRCYMLIDADHELIYHDYLPPYSIAWPPEPSWERDASIARGEHLIIVNHGCNSIPPTSFVRATGGNVVLAFDTGMFSSPARGSFTAPASAPTYTGNCLNPDDTAKDGSRCGGRAASVRPGGW